MMGTNNTPVSLEGMLASMSQRVKLLEEEQVDHHQRVPWTEARRSTTSGFSPGWSRIIFNQLNTRDLGTWFDIDWTAAMIICKRPGVYLVHAQAYIEGGTSEKYMRIRRGWWNGSSWTYLTRAGRINDYQYGTVELQAIEIEECQSGSPYHYGFGFEIYSSDNVTIQAGVTAAPHNEDISPVMSVTWLGFQKSSLQAG